MAVPILGRLFVWLAVIAGSLLLAFIVILILQFGDRRAADNARGPKGAEPAKTFHPSEVAVARVVLESRFLRPHEFSGRLLPKRETRLGFELGGQIAEVLVEVGQAVDIGQVVAILDTQLLEAQVTQLGFQIQRAEAVLAELVAGPRETAVRAAAAELAALAAEAKNATDLRLRQAELVAQGAVSQQEFDGTRAIEQAIIKRQLAAQQRLEELEAGTRPEQIAAQAALVQALKSEQHSILLQIQKATLVAPYPGAITRQHADVGQVLAAGQPLFDLVQHDLLEAHIGVTAAVAACLIPGQTYPLRLERQSIAAELLRIVPVVEAHTQTMTAIFAVTPPPSSTANPWVPGRLVRLPWETPVAAEGVWVPNDALARGRRGLWCLYTIEPLTDSAGLSESAVPVRQQQVEILYSNQQWSYVRGTLPADAWVVVQGANRLLEGQWVQPTPMVLSPAPTEGETDRAWGPDLELGWEQARDREANSESGRSVNQPTQSGSPAELPISGSATLPGLGFGPVASPTLGGGKR